MQGTDRRNRSPPTQDLEIMQCLGKGGAQGSPQGEVHMEGAPSRMKAFLQVSTRKRGGEENPGLGPRLGKARSVRTSGIVGNSDDEGVACTGWKGEPETRVQWFWILSVALGAGYGTDRACRYRIWICPSNLITVESLKS